jgi:hypothetical protein
MSKQFDFDINNYTIADLEKFLNLTMGYNDFEIKEKERIMRNKLLKAIENEKSKKRRLAIEKNVFQFLDEAKRMLMEKLSKTKNLSRHPNSSMYFFSFFFVVSNHF